MFFFLPSNCLLLVVAEKQVRTSTFVLFYDTDITWTERCCRAPLGFACTITAVTLSFHPTRRIQRTRNVLLQTPLFYPRLLGVASLASAPSFAFVAYRPGLLFFVHCALACILLLRQISRLRKPLALRAMRWMETRLNAGRDNSVGCSCWLRWCDSAVRLQLAASDVVHISTVADIAVE